MLNESTLNKAMAEKDSILKLRISKEFKDICALAAKKKKLSLSGFTRVALVKYLGELNLDEGK